MTKAHSKALTLMKSKPALTAANALNAPAKVVSALDSLVKAATEYAKTRDMEQTKRLEIASRLQVELARVQGDTAALQAAIAQTFELRAATVTGLFEAFDKAQESGNEAASLKALDALVGIACDSPLAGLAAFHRARQGEVFEF